MISIKVNGGIHIALGTIYLWSRPLGTTGGGGEARDILALVGQREIDIRTFLSVPFKREISLKNGK